MRLTTRWLVALGCLGAVLLWGFLWWAEHTAPPALPLVVAVLLLVVGLVVGPWMVLVSRRLKTELEANRVFQRVIAFAAALVAVGIVAATMINSKPTTLADSPAAPEPPADVALGVVMISIFAAGVLTLVGAVLLPWTFVLTRAITRERAARVRAEERAEVAAHLHDSVLQALTLIHKQAEDPRAVRGLTRRTDRELRAWLYGGPPAGGDDFAGAVKAAAEEVEDRFDITVELATLGTCRLDGPARAVVGAVREALTNAAKHAGVGHVSVFAEVTGDELDALVHDRGRGFDLSACNGPDRPVRPVRHGIADSIDGRMRQYGGSAAIRSAPGAGTEVELRMPLRRRHG
jgi:signal transduction histidine kinase